MFLIRFKLYYNKVFLNFRNRPTFATKYEELFQEQIIVSKIITSKRHQTIPLYPFLTKITFNGSTCISESTTRAVNQRSSQSGEQTCLKSFLEADLVWNVFRQILFINFFCPMQFLPLVAINLNKVPGFSFPRRALSFLFGPSMISKK